MNQPQELPAGIGVVFPFRKEEDWKTIIKIAQDTARISPASRRDDIGVKRALYNYAKSRTILNFSSPKILAKLGDPQAAMTLEVVDPKAAAELAINIYKSRGHKPQLFDSAEIEIGIPETFMYFVLATGFPPLLFWPKYPDPDMLATMAPPKPWIDVE